MSITMTGLWFVFVAVFLVVPESTVSLQQKAASDQVTETKYPTYFDESLIRRMIEANGYGYENYTVITEDGYILNINRIVHPNRTGSDRGYPLLLVNGYFMHSEAWLVQHRLDSNIALVFSNHGYDVWLGDHRGTMRSKGHVNLTADDKRLWDYSFHETGEYDIAAFTDFILKKTNHKDLIFSCMSLGCSFHSVLASKRPSYNQKIRAAIYFVPLVNNIRRVHDMNSLMSLLFRSQPFITESYEKAGHHYWFPFLGPLREDIYRWCRSVGNFPSMFIRILFGRTIHMPGKAICEIVMSSVGGTNAKSTRHVQQVYETGDFAEYDYGREENKKTYGTEWAPLYNMSKITSPVALYYSDADYFTTLQGVEKTIKSLGGPTYACMLPDFNHLDVATGTTFRYVLPDVIDLLNSLTDPNNHMEKFKSGKCPSMEWIRHLK